MKKNKTKKTVYLIRHGQTKGNVDGKWLGARSIHSLNEHGKKQSRYTALYLQQLNLTAAKIYSSPTARALEHAEIMQKKLGLPIEAIHSLSEINLGILEDRSREEGLKLVPQEALDWEKNMLEFHPPLGESAVQASERFFETVKLIAENSSVDDLIFITHGVVIKLFLARILKESIETGEKQINVPWTTHGTITVANFDGNYFHFLKVVENRFPDDKVTASYG